MVIKYAILNRATRESIKRNSIKRNRLCDDITAAHSLSAPQCKTEHATTIRSTLAKARSLWAQEIWLMRLAPSAFVCSIYLILFSFHLDSNLFSASRQTKAAKLKIIDSFNICLYTYIYLNAARTLNSTKNIQSRFIFSSILGASHAKWRWFFTSRCATERICPARRKRSNLETIKSPLICHTAAARRQFRNLLFYFAQKTLLDHVREAPKNVRERCGERAWRIANTNATST